MVVSAASLDQMNISLRRVHIDLFLQVNSQESRAYVHLMDLKIVLGGDGECQHNVAQASSQCICSPVVNAFNLVVSSTDYPGLEPLHIACSIALDLLDQSWGRGKCTST